MKYGIKEEIEYFFKKVFTTTKTSTTLSFTNDHSLDNLLKTKEDLAEFLLFLESRFNIILNDFELEEIVKLDIENVATFISKKLNNIR